MLIDRRSLVFATAGLAFSATARPASAAPEAADLLLPVWPGPPPGGGGPRGPVIVGPKGSISNIAAPTLEVFRPDRPNGAAVLVAGGGGYTRIAMETEARPAARWLTARGITAFVLSYRLPQEGWAAGPLAPLQDAQRALRVIRSTADLKLDPARVGVLGFSAGGHLLGLAAARSAFASYPPIDARDAASARPDEAALVYPVVTLEPPYDHTSTRVQLIGHHPDRAMAAEWSLETHIRDHCPPMFLVQAADDPIANVANTAILEQACRQAGVPVERHVLPSGGHGFGMGRPGTPSALWPDWYQDWLHARGALT